MPCESCSIQFTVFRRKRSCTECRRLYCNQCLIKRKDKILCDRCVVFTTRPISKIDLLKLKPKDLIFYLQSKHISTTGCVEKEELVNLVLIHANSISDGSSTRSSSQFSDDHFSNPFDQIKQTCQNLFTSFTDKIASDLHFDTKPSQSGQNENIFSQPRASATTPQQQYSFSNSTSGINMDQVNNPAMSQRNNSSDHRYSNASSSATNSPTSPVISVKSSSNSSTSTPSTSSKTNSHRSSQTREGRNERASKSSTSSHRNEDLPAVHEHVPKSGVDKLRPKLIDHIELTNSDCDCSDDETILKFTKEYMKRSPSNENDSQQIVEPKPGPSGSNAKDESSNTSSFEELGASGTSNGDWLFVSKASVNELPTVNAESNQPLNEESNTSANINLTHLTFQNVAAHSSHQNNFPSTSIDHTQRVRRLARRRSDGSINNSSGSKMFVERVEEMSEEETLRKRTKTSSCDKCGKNKRNLKRHVAKFKRQLESTNASDIEIKNQLDAFLEYLESCHKSSLDGTDTESNDERIDNAGNDSTADNATNTTNQNQTLADGEITDFDQLNDDDDNYDFEYDEGIHVYGTDHDETKGTPRQFVDINDYENSSDLEDLSVKQLKEVLMLNRIDFKGCCEKTELLDRVKRLWTELHSVPSIDKLPSDDLCKICMDAPIECVILECGHMATCTGCGKVLSECPICRQYIVRVVRFFRA
ncbi:E3 ubiquitin-protein ligase rififylin [Pseudolycoriella hygida]|uniref:E3 ubiquitin-protein ligase rififylin n=1 Tax=Pseudolycoriella hygida TaxID=35572 RepID=A0A9Q0N5M3_9DIPT|nr:E3 ubiquitin-protein ligase rififylin [Pseudolycoriella hygida]